MWFQALERSKNENPGSNLDPDSSFAQKQHKAISLKTASVSRFKKILSLCTLALSVSSTLHTVSAQTVTQQCKDISILPTELMVTESRDHAGNHTDIHTFNRFFTYQVPHDGRPSTNVVATKFRPAHASWKVKDKQGKVRDLQHQPGHHEEEDLLLRLRSSLNSAKMDESDQGMRVSVIEEETKRVVVDGSTEDADERSVHLDSIHISSKLTYIIKYEFFEKSPVMGSTHHKTIAGSHMGSVSCTKPFVVQELAIISKDLLRERAANHLSHQDKQEHDISALTQKCDFSMLDNSNVDLQRGENGLYCQKEHYHYSLVGESPQDLNTIFEKKFKVVGAQNEPVTILFDLTLSFDFASSAQLKALIRRIDPGHADAEYIYDPLSCLYDHSCVETSQIGKNELNIDVILTSGDYELIIFDQQENDVRNWLTSHAGLRNVPFSFELTASPVVQNEERVMCANKLYLVDSFIQNRFISGRDGQKFVFEDSILLNVVNNTQHVNIEPEQDMLLKVAAKQSYGVNMKMSLCEGLHDEEAADDWKLHLQSARCPVHSSQIGNNEILYASVERGKSYVLVLDYTNAILALNSFYDCPHTHFKLSMIKEEETEKILAQHEDAEHISKMSKESDTSLAHFFDSVSREKLGQLEHRMEPKFVYHYPINTKLTAKSQSHIVTRRDFTIQQGDPREMLIEIFYESWFYDLEILVESKDAPETKAHSSSQLRKSDITKFKGSKRILTILEPGDYTFLVIAKLPAVNTVTSKYSVKCFEFQLYSVTSETLKNRVMVANSLNLLGILGVHGKNFGQSVQMVPTIHLTPQETIEFSFTLGDSENLNPFLDIQVIDADSKGDQLDIRLYQVHHEIVQEKTASGHTIKQEKETLTHPKSSRYFDDWEEGVSFLALASGDLEAGKNYRVVIKNRDTVAVVRAKIKIMMTENSKVLEDIGHHTVPSDIDEISRIKPKVPGLKESSFIQGSNAVMRTFKVASLNPFVPKSKEVYQASFQTGESSDNTFMKGIEFEVKEHSTQIFAQLFVMQAQHDLFLVLYREGEEGSSQIVARSNFGKYANFLGPAPLVPGHYKLVVHPNQESTSLPQGTHGFKFGLDVLIEQSEIGGASDFTAVVEEVEMCNHRQMPDSFNGPGFISPLSGQTLQHFGKYRLAEILEGTALKFDLQVPSLIAFYFEVPEGLQAEASLETVKGTHQTVVTTKDLNRDDETFLRQDDGFSHRGVIQFREFLSPGPHVIRLLAWETAGGFKHQAPRCEAFEIAFSVNPINRTSQGFPIGEECLNTQYMQEHMTFDEVKEGNLAYPLSENTPDVAYIDLTKDGEGPFLFYFQVQHDQRLSGLLGVSLSKYDPQTSGFKQTALYSSPQDGIVQLFAIVESGTYAIGVQTLTSTRSVFIASGLSGKYRVSLSSNLLPETCMHLRYTYLIAPAQKGGVRQMSGGPLDFMQLMFGGGMQKMVEGVARDEKLLGEVGDQEQLSSCVHDDLPGDLPIGGTGFDKQYKLLVQEKPSDTLNLVIEQDSVVRVHIHTYNPNNQIRAFIYSSNDEKDKKPLGYSVGGRTSSSLFMSLKHMERAYRLVLEYESLDQDDACPIALVRIIAKPINDTIRENLACRGKPLPPSTVAIKSDDVVVSGEFAFPGDWLAKAVKEQGAGMEYDIIMEWPFADPNATYYMDIESRSDFLTGQLSFNLLYEHHDKTLRPLGHSEQVGTAMEGGELVQRLKLLDREGDLADDIDLSGAILRLKLPDHAFEAFKFAKESGLIPEGSEMCHNFELSIRAELRKENHQPGGIIDNEPSRLMRVRWEGHETNHNLFDPRTRIYASLEFDKSMKSHFAMLKTNDWVALQPTHTGDAGSTNTQPDIVKPLTKSIHPEDQSTIVLEFAAGTLAKGWCHNLQMISIGGPFGQIDFDQERLSNDLVLCTTNCLCDQTGTSSCDEAKGQCICKHSHSGDTCSSCEEGFTKDPQTKECHPQSLCKANGGDVDCNGHGACRQQGGNAICTCAPGFKNDGLSQCGKCIDPMFDYPKCQVRSFIIEDPAINCHGLSNTFPTSLFEQAPDHRQEDPNQGPDGVIDWAQRFRLKQDGQETKYSTMKFMIPQTSVVRLFVDTAKSGVLVKFRLLDSDDQEVLSSSSYEDSDDSYIGAATDMIIAHRPESKEPHEAPYTLQLEFKHLGLAKEHHEQDEFCPIVDIRLIVEPFNTASSTIKCHEDQMLKPYKTSTEPWAFSGMTRAVTQKVALHNEDETMYQHEGTHTNNFALLKYNLAIRNGDNALTILATYPFSELQMAMRLIDDRTGGIVSKHRTSSLEGEKHTSNIISLKNDMASFIEEPRIQAGMYTLEILIPKAAFLPSKEHKTCLNFDLVVEYVSRTHGQNAEHDGLYDIIAIKPFGDKNMWQTDEKVIDIDFDREFEFDDIVGSLTDRRYVCSLYNKQDHSNVIHPVTSTKEQGSTLRLHFNFTHEARIPNDHRCYSLKCSTKKSKGAEYIRQPEEAEFCFESKEAHNSEAQQKCNPHALPSLSQDGNCICSDPYSGNDCQSCQEGFKVAEGLKDGHVECIIDEDHMSKAVCNSHGRPQSGGGFSHINNVKCECDKGYGGQYCDFCSNPEFAFPDCSEEISSAIYNTEIQHEFLSRNKYDEQGYSTVAQRYFPEGALEPSIFNEECGWVDYPDTFDRTEFMREFNSGEFHISDVYVVNHKQDNVIKFKPRTLGHLKILLQQPESKVINDGPAEATFDLEIGIYDPEQRKFIQSSMNTHLRLASGTPVKLEYASLAFQVQEYHLNKNMYIFFRALNFTDDGTGHKANEGCLTLYLEAEFRKNIQGCRSDPHLQPSQQITTLKSSGEGQVSTHSINDKSDTFFTYQDFYLPEDRALGEAPYEVSISLQQKFHESNTLDILIEVLQQSVQFDKIRKEAHQPNRYNRYASPHQADGTQPEEEQGRAQEVRGQLSPTCAGTCLIGGEKSFNEMIRVLDLDAMTLFRVWIMQNRPTRSGDSTELEPCANYQLHVRASPSSKDIAFDRKLSQQIRCPSEELPENLNVARYLKGPGGGQKDFHFSQAYRVDHLWHNHAHQMKFILKEQTVVRIAAPVHRHLEFDIVLNQETGAYSHNLIMRAKKEDHHIAIFALLDRGTYHFKLEFMSDAALLQLPCQTIHLEMAMTRSSVAKEQMENIRSNKRVNEAENHFSLSQLFKHSSTNSLFMQKQGHIQIEHVSTTSAQKLESSELFVEVFREKFDIAQDDNIGLFIEVQTDFLLVGAHVVLQNTVTGTIMEDERHEGTSTLSVGFLHPGQYVILVYTHKCITNIASDSSRDIQAFDLLIDMKVRPLRTIHGGQLADAIVPIQLNDETQDGKEVSIPPLLVTEEELHCKSEYLSLPSELDPNGIVSQIDFSEAFFLPTFSYQSHQIEYTARKDHYGLRIILAKSNSKVTVIGDDSRKVIAESRPIDDGQAQLLIATELEEDIKYIIILEFSENHGAIEQQGLRNCHNFILAIKTFSKSQIDHESYSGSNPGSLQAQTDGEFRDVQIPMKKKTERHYITIPGATNIDLQFVLDYSASFYPADLILTATSKSKAKISDKELSQEEIEEVQLISSETTPTLITFNRKQATTYLFVNIVPGTYEVTLHQRFKPKDTNSPVTLSYRAWAAGASSAVLERGGMSGLQIYQSAAEENETPRAPNKLPLDLNSYKFMAAPQGQSHQSENVLFSGSIQLDEQDSQNHIKFQVQETSLLRAFVERAGLILTLEQIDDNHNKPMPGMSGQTILRKINKGHYRIKFREGTQLGRTNSRLMAPKAHLTLVLAEQRIEQEYNQTWSSIIDGCDSGASFPLALRQQKQADIHQLYYDYPLIKVDPNVLRNRQVLQTYNFRVNVTSRMYFEVGMHMHSQHVTLQLNSLNEKAYTVQGKQRGNINVIDIQVGPGDYSVAIKQPTLSPGFFERQCGIFSLQGLIEPLALMSEAAKTGEIIQKGVIDVCSEQAAANDQLPMKIHGSEGTTRGGGELHIDATGHFTKKFRNVLFRVSEDSITRPESDRVNIEVLEDSWLHLAFQYKEQGFNQIKATVTDTLMLGQQVQPQSSFGINNIEGDLVEQVYEFHLVKGHHYSLAIYYVGSAARDEEGNPTCSFYDLSMSISRNTQILLATQCTQKDEVPTVRDGLPKKITDSDLDHNGNYNFTKLLQVHEFDAGTNTRVPVIAHAISLELSQNFDISASVEFEFDQAIYSMQLNEVSSESSDDSSKVQEHVRLQQPLTFKQNDDHQRTAVRQIIGDGIEAGHDQNKRNILFFYNHEPGFIGAVNKDSPKGGHGSCLFLKFIINIRSSEQATEQLYSNSQQSKKGEAPQVMSCSPADSPTFLHDRPEQLTFDIVLNTKPFIKGADTSAKSEDFLHLREAIKLKASVVSLADGMQSNIQIQAANIYSNNKEYRDDEWHLGVVFDVSQFARSATEKLMHAQLLLNSDKLVNEDQVEFGLEKHLEMRGLPIYVFEETDVAQIVKEESDDIQKAVQNETVGVEAMQEQSSDISSTKSDLEKEVQEIRQEEQAEAVKDTVECLCVHGSCHVGQSTCDRCEKGWTGEHCDTPTTDETLQNVNQNDKKDFTEDGLYEPVQTSDERKTGAEIEKGEDEKVGEQSLPVHVPEEAKQDEKPASHHHEQHQQQTQVKKAKKIDDDDVWGERAHEKQQQHSPQQHVTHEHTNLNQENILHEDRMPAEQDANKNMQKGALVATIAIFFYCLCVKKSEQQGSVPKKRYGALGAQDPDSDDEQAGVDDPRERRKMLEMHSFGDDGKKGAYRRGRREGNQKGSSTARDESDIISKPSGSSQSRGSFPMASFSSQSQKSNSSGKSSNQAADRQGSRSQGLQQQSEADETGELLQRELELFAQDDDAEEQALMVDQGFNQEASSSQQPGNTDQFPWSNDPQSWSATDNSDAQAQPNEDGNDDLLELENYFEQNKY